MRLGNIVTLTLGQTKEIDLFVETPRGREVTVDVKGLKNTTNWPITVKRVRGSNFYVLVTYLNKFEDPNQSPEVFVIPSGLIGKYLGRWSGTGSDQTAVDYSRVKGTRYKDAWHLIS